MSTPIQSENLTLIKSENIRISSGYRSWPAYVAAPESQNRLPAIVLLHSFKGLEPGYNDMINKLATEDFVVIAPEWQSFESKPRDEVVKQLVLDCIAYLRSRNDVNQGKLGLTGFCAGGRYTMLFLPQLHELKSAVAFYGFPYGKGFANQSSPAEFIKQIDAPMLIIHGTRDQASQIADIYRYAIELDAARRHFEMKIYQGEPHGFMIENGKLSQSFSAVDAIWQAITFFNRTLK